MNAMTAIPTLTERLPFSALSLSNLNPRTKVNDDAIVQLADNIRAFGLIQNLAGWRSKPNTVEIVAGGRRLRALALLQDDPRFQLLDVKIAPDEETARQWATSENQLREQLHPADEIRDYARMKAKGATVPEIALAFGATEQHVYRRLALADLPDKVIEALAADEITLAMAAAFTVSNDAALTIEVLDRARRSAISVHEIKRSLQPHSVGPHDRRVCYVGLDAYKAAGGSVRADLFEDKVYVEDIALLDDLFAAKLAARAEAAQAETGWLWVATHDGSSFGYHQIEEGRYERLYRQEGVLTEAQAERYDELSELANDDALDDQGVEELAALQAILDGTYSVEQVGVSGCVVYVGYNGTEMRVEGLVRPEDKATALEQGVLRKSQHETEKEVTKSPYSAKLLDDLRRVSTGAHQHALLRDPDLILDLLAYQLSHDLAWRNPFGLSRSAVPNLPSTEQEGYAPAEGLLDGPRGEMWDKDLGKSFRAFRAKGPDHVRGELIRGLAALFQGGSEELKAVIAKTTTPSIREVWTPTAANFFSRVGGPYLNELWRDLLGLKEDHPTVTTFAKLKKGEKAAKLEALFADEALRGTLGLSEDQSARIATWLPDGIA